MKLTTNFKLKKPDYSDPVDIQDINDNMDIIDSEVGVIGDLSSLTTTEKTNLVGAISEVKNETETHLADDMPHQFIDNGKNYRWGFRTKNGQPQFIYEEVI